MRTQVAPSILSSDFAKLGEEVSNICKYDIDLIHCDVMDGVFVPNITFGIKAIKDIKKYSTKPLDVHLMIIDPSKYIKDFAEAGADYISIHTEAKCDVLKTLKDIRKLKCKAGLVINPETSLDEALDYLPVCDLVLVMSVHPGFGGQSFIEETLEKVRELKRIKNENGYKYLIEIDGGINEETAPKALKAGAEIIVAGNAIFNSKNKEETIKKLR